MAASSLPVTVVLAMTMLLLLALKKLYTLKKYLRRCSIPGPYGLPYLGLTPFLPKKPYEYFAQLSEKYGDVFCCRLGTSDVIVLSDFAAVDYFFRKKGKVFGDRFQKFPEADIPVGFPIVHYDDRVAKLRSFTASNLNKLDRETGTLEDAINEEVARFCSYVDQSYSNEPVHTTGLSANCIISILSKIVTGKQMVYDSSELKNLYDSARNLSMEGNLSVIFRYRGRSKLIRMLDIHFNDIRMRASNGGMQLSVKSRMEVDEFIAQDREGKAPKDCLLWNFLSEMKRGVDTLTFGSENAMRGMLESILSAGIEGTLVMCSWMFVLLTKYQAIQERIREEIYTKIGHDRVPALAEKNGMDYTNAFFLEIQRFCSVGPLGAAHTVAEDTYYDGHFIPEGTHILANIWAIHHNEDTYSNPSEFKPERFIDDQGKFVDDKRVIMFGHGLRSCPGRLVVLRQMFLILVQVLQKFRLLPPEGVNPTSLPTDGTFCGVVAHPPAVKTRFVPINRARESTT